MVVELVVAPVRVVEVEGPVTDWVAVPPLRLRVEVGEAKVPVPSSVARGLNTPVPAACIGQGRGWKGRERFDGCKEGRVYLVQGGRGARWGRQKCRCHLVGHGAWTNRCRQPALGWGWGGRVRKGLMGAKWDGFIWYRKGGEQGGGGKGAGAI